MFRGFRDLSAESMRLTTSQARRACATLTTIHPRRQFLESLMSRRTDAVGSVVVAVVLDRDLQVLPPHVEVVRPLARTGSASAAGRPADQQPQPGLLGDCAPASCRPTRWHLADSTDSPMARDIAARPRSRNLPRRRVRRVSPPRRLRRARARSKAVRARDVTGSDPSSRSQRQRVAAEVRMPSGTRVGQTNSMGTVSSIHFAPYSRDAASPATTPVDATTATPPRHAGRTSARVERGRRRERRDVYAAAGAFGRGHCAPPRRR